MGSVQLRKTVEASGTGKDRGEEERDTVALTV